MISCSVLLLIAYIHLGIAEKRDQPRITPLSIPDDENENGNSVCLANNTLPSLQSGGLVFFLHIPKTGGTTIRRNLEKIDGINYVLAKDYKTYSDSVGLVEEMILGGSEKNSVLFYEIHAKTAPSFFKISNRLKRWRETALGQGVPYFFFSLVREPLSFSFSHFNFFHLQKRNPTFERCNATEDEFLRKSVYNPQCQFLFEGEPSMRKQVRNTTDSDLQELMVQPEDCKAVTEQLFDLMDWVGKTGLLSAETIPLLSKLLHKPRLKWENYRVSRKENGYIPFGRENVSSFAIETISEMSRLDKILYDEVESRYQYSETIARFD